MLGRFLVPYLRPFAVQDSKAQGGRRLSARLPASQNERLDDYLILYSTIPRRSSEIQLTMRSLFLS